jgi:S-adenosylmethionine hydrolase
LTGFFVFEHVVMIFLFTDFGSSDIYVGQLKTVLLGSVTSSPIIDLLHDAPDHDVESGAHLLAALSATLPESSVVLAVVDPGVGGSRRPIMMQADGGWYVGPDNGLLSVIAARSRTCRVWEILWRPEVLSDSFHGRDLFAPVAAMLANKGWWKNAFKGVDGLQVQLGADDLERVVYVDHYGNVMTGLRAEAVPKSAVLDVGGIPVSYARTFSEVPAKAPFWTGNSLGLVEVAINCGSAAENLGLRLGSPVRFISPSATQ